MSGFIHKFWQWVDERAIVRRSCLFATFVLTFQSYYWAAAYANSTTGVTFDVAAVILAVTGPVTALQGFVFKWYTESRTN